MATLKNLRLKIHGVKKTRQITKAMNMVAASKLRGSQQRMEHFRPYATKFAEVLGSLAARPQGTVNALLEKREQVKTVDVLLMTSDRGLCGSFNVNLLAKAEGFAKKCLSEGKAVRFVVIGKKGRDYIRKSRYQMLNQHVGIVGGRFGFNIASTIADSAIDSFLSGDTDEVHIVLANFVSVARQTPVARQILPIPPVEPVDETGVEKESEQYLPEHICEPDAATLMADLLPKSVAVQIYSALLETSASEHAARMMAMDNATKACNDMVANLTRVYNRARQAAVTAELMDIVGGAEALKG
ncbi:MAG: ATP synthase F1 subunit gamma [Pseudomonadota bacterium]